jgi:tetratricopeptide (TPR) repeat protein
MTILNFDFKISVFILPALILISCGGGKQSQDQDSMDYDRAVADFYMSLAASQTDQSRFAFNKMNDVAVAFPEEAAAWANLGVYAMRQGNLELAADRLERARNLQPNNPDILFLASLVESRRGAIGESIRLLRAAAEADPGRPKILFALAGELEREDDRGNAAEIESVLRQLNEISTDNLVVLLELIRVAAKENEATRAESDLDRLLELSQNWSEQNRDQLQSVLEQARRGNTSDLLLELSFLRSGLGSETVFQDDLLEVQLPPTDVGYLITRFLHLSEPEVAVAEPDTQITLTRSVPELPETRAQWIKGVTLLEDAPPFPVAISNGEVVVDSEVRLAFPGENGISLPVAAFTEIDFNYNFRNDIAVAGSSGFRLYRQNSDQTFSDVTGELGLDSSITNDNYTGVWAFDADMDGDLDLLLARSDRGPVMLRNNGDDTFTMVQPFSGLNAVLDFGWADLDGDGVPEAIFLEQSGEITVFKNLRGGRFDDGLVIAQNRAALTIADMTADSQFEIISADSNGNLRSSYINTRTSGWTETDINTNGTVASVLEPGATNLFSADLDNNGALDLIVSTPEQTLVWLGDTSRQLKLLETSEMLPGGITSVFDVDGDERLDLLGIDEDLQPFQLVNSGTKEYFARSIRARASGAEGDRRINSFGIGGEMEVRSGLLYQKQLISSPIVHFGLGEYEEAQMLRIIWPNGSVQAEFAELGMGATIFNEQILKGSCPWLFTGDGNDMHFVTDILWRSPLGLRINALETAGVEQTLDRVRIPSDKISAKDGYYDVRITAELWETHFFDYVSLVAVDHPEGSEIFIDERFAFPSPDLSTRLMETPTPVNSVTDHRGKDLTDLLSAVDEVYASPFQKTKYQGLTEEYSIEIELNDAENPQWLILSGWLRPTDSSINLALSQGSIDPPKGLRVEVSTGNDEWSTLHENYGFPAGKLKSILIDLEEVGEAINVRKVRLTTTTEIYWDGIFQAGKMDSSLLKETDLNAASMDLRYRGFSEWNRENETSPKLPDYSYISSTNQRWRDLEGYHTRFGDVSELLHDIDDRYVIMNAGDELVLRFKEADPPKEGYKRSYIFVSDGWEKDGDYNTEASATVLPLPYHGQQEYSWSGNEILFDDPVFRRHSDDWINYHTRYITSDNFRKALLFD